MNHTCTIYSNGTKFQVTVSDLPKIPKRNTITRTVIIKCGCGEAKNPEFTQENKS